MARFVLVHGAFHGAWCYDALARDLAAAGHEVDTFDLPGHGADTTPHDEITLDTYAQRVAEVIGEEGEPVVLVGHSMGGIVAQETYARYPGVVKALALTFTSPAFAGGSTEFTKQFLAARLAPLDEGKTMAEVAAQLMPTMGSRSAHAEEIMAGIAPATYRKAVHLLTTFDRRKELAAIKVPTLLIAGENDKTAPPSVMEKMAQKIPGAEYVCIPQCGHLGPMDKPKEFNAALLAFLQKHKL
jgi:3-oxoadipate enol-lactonase